MSHCDVWPERYAGVTVLGLVVGVRCEFDTVEEKHEFILNRQARLFLSIQFILYSPITQITNFPLYTYDIPDLCSHIRSGTTLKK